MVLEGEAEPWVAQSLMTAGQSRFITALLRTTSPLEGLALSWDVGLLLVASRVMMAATLAAPSFHATVQRRSLITRSAGIRALGREVAWSFTQTLRPSLRFRIRSSRTTAQTNAFSP